MEELHNILRQFEPIDLKEMESVQLMNRTDTKYIISLDRFDGIMREIMQHYRILEIEGKRISRYKTLYFDTNKFNLYNEHHNGKLNRYKVRHRTYVESDTGFLEVKFKNNKGRTIKNRMKIKEVPMVWSSDNIVYLNKILPFESKVLIPVLWVNYSRYTLVHKTIAERLTIDLSLEFIRGEVKKTIDNLVIAEVKQDKKKVSSFVQVMKKYRIRKGSISKYCMGLALTCKEVKKNNFKNKLHLIERKYTRDVITNG